MTRLVYGKVQAIEPAIVLGFAQAREAVNRQNQRERIPPPAMSGRGLKYSQLLPHNRAKYCYPLDLEQEFGPRETRNHDQ